MKAVKKIIIIILSILVGLLAVYNIYNFVCIRIMKQNIATISGYAILEVISGSMEPTIKVGDMIIINTKDKDYKENDIVTFIDDSTLVTHRIISIDEDTIITKGDHNDTADEAISSSNIIGKYVTKINNGGRILASFKSPITMILIFVIGILFCVFISMDKNGNIILDKEEEEFQEYLKTKELKEEGKKNLKKDK